jgi:alpha-mannosidase
MFRLLVRSASELYSGVYCTDIVHGTFQGWLFNTPMHLRRVGADVAAQWISTRGPFQIRNGRNVILDTVKRGDDDDFFNAGSGKTVVLRLYEAYGGHASPEIIT